MSPVRSAAPGKVPFLDLPAQHRELREEILSAWAEILDRAAFIGGEAVVGFEREFAAASGSACCVGVSSGTAALRLALQAAGVGPGDEVIVPAHTFIATAEAVGQAGARPVLADVRDVDGNLDPAAAAAAVTPRTRAIVPVHLYGRPADVDPLRELTRRHGLLLIEDAAQAQGAVYRGRPVGSLGDAAAFSFYPGKNLGACGEAGAVTTGDEGIDRRLRMLRDHGQSRKYVHELEGTNARLDALQAAALRIKLRHLGDWNGARGIAARRYDERLAGSTLRTPAPVGDDSRHVHHLYVVRHPERDRLRAALEEAGIGCGLHYPVPLHLQPAYAGMGLERGSFPAAEAWADECLSLPMYPGLTETQQDRVCELLRSAAG